MNDDANSPTASIHFLDTTFSYFDNQHAIIPTSAVKSHHTKAMDTKGWKAYFIITFLLGTSLFSHYTPEYYLTTTYQQLIGPMDAIIDKISILPLLDFQSTAYRYRKFLLTNDRENFNKFRSTQNPAEPKLTPPTFTIPWFPLMFGALKISWVHNLSVAKA